MGDKKRFTDLESIQLCTACEWYRLFLKDKISKNFKIDTLAMETLFGDDLQKEMQMMNDNTQKSFEQQQNTIYVNLQYLENYADTLSHSKNPAAQKQRAFIMEYRDILKLNALAKAQDREGFKEAYKDYKSDNHFEKAFKAKDKFIMMIEKILSSIFKISFWHTKKTGVNNTVEKTFDKKELENNSISTSYTLN